MKKTHIPVQIILPLVIGAVLPDYAMSNGIGLRLPSAQASRASAMKVLPTPDRSGFYAAASGLTASEQAGREIWYKATAGNSRFYTYVFPQRLNVLVDWYRVLNAHEHEDRFAAWGLINDPDCCMPGTAGCPARTLEETYGFEWCPGDEELLKYVGHGGYRDPACDHRDTPALKADPHHGSQDQRQSACDLAFGTSTGAVGFRKFPNPRFDRSRWIELNGSLASWEGYRLPLPKKTGTGSSEFSRLADGSIEPPFLIGITCASCHVAFDPLNPPKNPADPKWENIRGTIGNQYLRMSEILTSGMAGTTLEAQLFGQARPGTSDTSAIATDQVHNPGSTNAIIHTQVRPTFDNEQVMRWRKVAACEAANPTCWCEPGRDGKCWRRERDVATVHHLLKGGEDSIGALEAIQRVYINIGSCSEQCWANHLTDLRQLDPHRRNFGQTPFDIGQCRRDCASFRAIEDRLENIHDFLLSREGEATDLARARELALRDSNPNAVYTMADLEADLNKKFGENSVGRGREVFADKCARCHSSTPELVGGAFRSRDFRARDATGMRADWLGSDESVFASEVGTHRCRSLHSNHMMGHIWEEYGSETLRAQPPDPNIREPHDGGRGYYRNISLLSVWAHAPFLHNNSVGPELCGKPANRMNNFYRSPYVDADGQARPVDNALGCWSYDPSVEGRFKLYMASMRDLLNPRSRTPKISRTDNDINVMLGPRIWDGKREGELLGFNLVLPAGFSVSRVTSFQHKAFVNDMLLAKRKSAMAEEKLVRQFGRGEGKKIAGDLRSAADALTKEPARMAEVLHSFPRLMTSYSFCTAEIENEGHPFGEDLSDGDKDALIAFLATL
ncbi:hypothetical protein SAMN05216412_102368 [Nitrosospira multiformis]|uniref:Cytochrome c domain-containing protein n=1 Tax=Nitrosospira multiformis TaxID=1231 RepID=A0A1I0ARR5_9PROT|nr:hypothetical protein [Nitrosospira multiformis]SES97069.1 hypothetical protein SAMN05216412_102368 [Nitrosospira multiformis]